MHPSESDASSGPPQTSKMEGFASIVNDSGLSVKTEQSKNIYETSSILINSKTILNMLQKILSTNLMIFKCDLKRYTQKVSRKLNYWGES